MAVVTKPLSEAGYYVMPVAMVSEAFKENGLTQPTDMHAIAPAKLRQIFGADAALYITVTKFGVSYTVVNSETAVQVQGKLVDLKTGTTLWLGSAQAFSLGAVLNRRRIYTFTFPDTELHMDFSSIQSCLWLGLFALYGPRVCSDEQNSLSHIAIDRCVRPDGLRRAAVHAAAREGLRPGSRRLASAPAPAGQRC